MVRKLIGKGRFVKKGTSKGKRIGKGKLVTKKKRKRKRLTPKNFKFYA